MDKKFELSKILVKRRSRFVCTEVIIRTCMYICACISTHSYRKSHVMAFSNYTLVILYLDAAGFYSYKYFYCRFLCGKSAFRVASDHRFSAHKMKCLLYACHIPGVGGVSTYCLKISMWQRLTCHRLVYENVQVLNTTQ